MNNRAGLILAGVSVLTVATLNGASAFQIDPQCAKMNDKIACTCALQTGGTVGFRRGQMWWQSPRRNQGEFQKCVGDNGGNK
jgi:hypothetical protein